MSRVNTQSKYDFAYRGRIAAVCQERWLNDQKLDNLRTLIKSRMPFDEKAGPMPNGMSVDAVVSLMSKHVELQILNAVSHQVAIKRAAETQELLSALHESFTEEVFKKYRMQIFAFIQLQPLLTDAINEACSRLVLDISEYVCKNFSVFEEQVNGVSEETDDEASSDEESDEYDSSFSPRLS